MISNSLQVIDVVIVPMHGTLSHEIDLYLIFLMWVSGLIFFRMVHYSDKNYMYIKKVVFSL